MSSWPSAASKCVLSMRGAQLDDAVVAERPVARLGERGGGRQAHMTLTAARRGGVI